MRKTILVILVFAIVSLFFFFPIFKGKVPFPGDLLMGEYAPYNSYSFLGYGPGGYPNKGQDFDVIRLLYPEKEFSIDSFKKLELPLWNPYNFSGTPHLASLQSGSFYPLNIIFFLFSFPIAWGVFIFFQPLLTGLFSYLFLRELRLGTKSSILSALVFAFSSYSIVWMEYGNIGHSILWMPLSMWLALKNLKKPSFLKSVTISLSLTFAILAGHIQVALYVLIFIFAFIIFNIFLVDKKNIFKKLFMSFLIFILPLLLSAIQLFPSIELFMQSARMPYPYEVFLKLLIPPYHIITMFIPDFFGNPATRNYWLSGTYIERVTYIGVIPLVFVIYSFFKKQSSTFWFFVISAVIILFLTFDNFFTRIFYSYPIPIFSTSVPTRIMFLFCFCLSVIAGFGLNAFEKDPNKKSFLKPVLILSSIFVFAWVFVLIFPLIDKSPWVQNLNISKRNLFLPTGIFFAGAAILAINSYVEKYKKVIIIFLIVLSLGDLFYFFHKITPFSTRETIYPPTEVLEQLKKIQGINRSWGYGSGYIATNLQTHEKTFSVDGYNALYLKKYGELLSSSGGGKIANDIPSHDAAIAPGYGESDLKNNQYRQRLLNLLGVKYILNKNDFLGADYKPDYNTFPQETYKLVWQRSPWQIYENKQVLPRVFLASNYIIETSKNEIVQKIFDKNFDLRNNLILEEKILLNPQINFSNDPNARVKIKEYSASRIIAEIDSKTNMILFMSDNFYSGWKVSIDGKFAKIYKADYSFRAVPVLKGNHEIIFSYYPDSFDLGVKLSIATSVLVVFIFILNRLRYVKK